MRNHKLNSIIDFPIMYSSCESSCEILERAALSSCLVSHQSSLGQSPRHACWTMIMCSRYCWDIWSNSWSFYQTRSLKINIFGACYFRTEPVDWTALTKFMNQGISPALPESLEFYRKLLGLGFKVVFLTGRGENMRNSKFYRDQSKECWIPH